MLFKRLKKKTGIDDKRVSAHNCRRYMATTEIANGRNQFDVQRQMRHRSIKMTNHYASLSIQQLQRSHEKYSPLKNGDSRPKCFHTEFAESPLQGISEASFQAVGGRGSLRNFSLEAYSGPYGTGYWEE